VRSGPPRAGPSTPPPALSPLATLQADWDRICRQALNDQPQHAPALTAVRPMRLDGERLILAAVDHNLDPRAFAPDAPALRLLERLIAGVCGRQLQVEPLASATGGSGASAGASRNPAYLQAQGHPLVQDLLERFEAEVVAREPSPRDRFLERRRGES